MSSPGKTNPLTFDSLNLEPNFLQVIKELGYEWLTPVQQQAIPPMFGKKDLLCEAQTGGGKTLAFAIPIIANLKLKKREIQALVLCPTRELCQQVAREFRKLGRDHAGMQVLVLAGGQPVRGQLFALEKGAHIAIGTPGRILDLLSREALPLERISTVVLDEADRMLDMGFREDVEAILRATPQNRQTAFFSATYPESVGELSAAHQKAPIAVKIAVEVTEKPLIRQVFCEIDQEKKEAAIRWLLQTYTPESGIIFCNTKKAVSELATALRHSRISALALHGDLEQFERDRVMAQIRNQSVRFVIATDVAARGIDIQSLGAVINYDLPSKPENYIHRIGRTGRAGKEGLAISLFGRSETFKLDLIKNAIEADYEKILLPPADTLRKDLKEKNAALFPAMKTLYISAGRKDKLRPGDILGALTRERVGIKGTDVGHIEIHDRYAYVAIAANSASTALRNLKEGGIKGRKLNVELLTDGWDISTY
ncbi:MAG: ATP-dependent RNA helicase DbpA [Oligoflexales bacterium]